MNQTLNKTLDTVQLRRLRFMCRRGTRELETLLVNYLNHHYVKDDERHQRVFEWLLSLEDDRLYDWILQGTEMLGKEVHSGHLSQAIDDYVKTMR